MLEEEAVHECISFRVWQDFVKSDEFEFSLQVTAEKNANWFLFWGGWGQTVRLYSYFNF